MSIIAWFKGVITAWIWFGTKGSEVKNKKKPALKSFYLKSLLFEEFNNVNGGMDVVGSWSVGSSSMRWRIGTSDTVVKALPSVRVII